LSINPKARADLTTVKGECRDPGEDASHPAGRSGTSGRRACWSAEVGRVSRLPFEQLGRPISIGGPFSLLGSARPLG
jgi:hypothetical protein